MNTNSEMIEVIQAHKDGRNVQWKFHTPVLGAGQDWTDLVVAEHPFNFSISDYRVKPEPSKPREGWICETVLHTLQPNGQYFHVREVLP